MFMFTVSDTIHIDAPLERCFLLSTDIEIVGWTIRMKPIEGKTTGKIVAGDKLLWAGWKFGFPQMHETLITRYEPPHFFQDTMGRGRFKRFQHDHSLYEVDGHTLLTDKIRFIMPLGFLGRIVGQHLMVPYISRLLRRRMVLLKNIAEGEDWHQFLPDDGQPG
jgi:ligand-binding SRPBCC domain-containing protein